MGLFDNPAQLKEALLKANQYEMEHMKPCMSEPFPFSRTMKKKMRRLFAGQNRTDGIVVHRKIRNWKKMLLIAALITVCMTATVMAYGPTRRAILSLFAEDYGEYTWLTGVDVGEEPGEPGVFEVYEPTFAMDKILEDAKVEKYIMSNSVCIVCENKNDYITYNQSFPNETSMNINTEGVELIETKVHGKTAYYYENLGVYNVFWEEDGFLFYVDTTLDKKVLFNIAESVERKK